MSRKTKSDRFSPYFDSRSGKCHDAQQLQDEEDSQTSKLGSKSPRKRARKYGDMTEDEVMKLLLPDRVAQNLDILFIGINPGLTSAYKGHHYAGPNNHFWPCLFESGLIPEKFSYQDDIKCPSYGIGLTNIVMRTTRGSSDLSRTFLELARRIHRIETETFETKIQIFLGLIKESQPTIVPCKPKRYFRKEIKDGVEDLISKIKRLKPLVACFNGKGIYEIFSRSKCEIGNQPECIPGTDVPVYVMPSTSGRTMTYPRASDKLRFFQELKELRDARKAITANTVAEDNT